MNRPNLNTLSKEVYQANKEKGFHDKEYSNEHLLCLVVGELMEAVEADRKGKTIKKYKGCGSKFSETFKGDNSFEQYFEFSIKDTVEDELADAVIRLLDLAGLRGLEYLDITIEKVTENLGFTKDSFKNNSFAHIIYALIWTLYDDMISLEGRIALMISDIETICCHLNIDLWMHVELKLKYNKKRPHKHGKKY